jgi:hypothetical protein
VRGSGDGVELDQGDDVREEGVIEWDCGSGAGREDEEVVN